MLLLLDGLVERNLVDPAARKSVAILFDYAAISRPGGRPRIPWPAARRRDLVRFLSWAQNPLIKRLNIAFCLVADKLTEFNDRLVESPHVAAIEIPLPDRAERLRFCAGRRSRARPAQAVPIFPPNSLPTCQTA